MPRIFRRTIGPIFSENAFHKEAIILNNNKTICNNDEIPQIFNKHFTELKNVDIDKILVNNIGNSGITRAVFNAIENKKFDQQ